MYHMRYVLYGTYYYYITCMHRLHSTFYIMQLSNSREGMAMERAGILLSIDIAHTPIHRRIAVTAPQ